ALGASVLLALFSAPAAAQRGWEPVVATAEPGRLDASSPGARPEAPAPSPRPAPSAAIKAFMVPPQLAERSPKATGAEPVAQRAPKAPETAAPKTTAVQQYCAN